MLTLIAIAGGVVILVAFCCLMRCHHNLLLELEREMNDVGK